MRRFLVVAATFAAGFPAFVAPAHSALFKCTSPDGTVTFQTRACDNASRQETLQGAGTASRGVSTVAAEPVARKSDGRVLALDEKVVSQNRAVADRDAAQRRDRCASYQANIDRQRATASAATTSATARKKATDEIAIQERRQKEDGCE